MVGRLFQLKSFKLALETRVSYREAPGWIDGRKERREKGSDGGKGRKGRGERGRRERVWVNFTLAYLLF